jgi:L-ascorbate metabolism protein UlaG (beta-lactamase superfamily)
MNIIYGILGVIIVIAIGFFALTALMSAPASPNNTNATSTPQITVEVIPISHATGVLRWDNTVMYFDPLGNPNDLTTNGQANIILVTDIHPDHLSTSTLSAVVGSSTTLIVPQAVKDMLPKALASRAMVLGNGQSTTTAGFTITSIAAYNLPDAENNQFHTKGRGNGYVIEKGGTRVYIAGDTAGTPEMRALQDIDVAFVPMNLPYTMSVEEAADAVLAFKPRVVYPYHYRNQDATFADINKFKQLVNTGDSTIQVVLGNWYPTP